MLLLLFTLLFFDAIFPTTVTKRGLLSAAAYVDVVGLNGSCGGTNAPNRNNITHVNDTPEDDGLIFS